MENKDLKYLIQQAKEGDSEAFDYIYEQFLTLIYQYIYFRVGNKQTAEDLAQNTFLRAFQSLPRYEQGGAGHNKEPLAYFFTIARNQVIDFYRRKKDLPLDQEFAEKLPSEENAEIQMDREIATRRLYRAIYQLKEEQQQAIVLKYISGWDNARIAAVLGKKEDAVRQMQSRGLKKIKELLENES